MCTIKLINPHLCLCNTLHRTHKLVSNVKCAYMVNINVFRLFLKQIIAYPQCTCLCRYRGKKRFKFLIGDLVYD